MPDVSYLCDLARDFAEPSSLANRAFLAGEVTSFLLGMTLAGKSIYDRTVRRDEGFRYRSMSNNKLGIAGMVLIFSGFSSGELRHVVAANYNGGDCEMREYRRLNPDLGIVDAPLTNSE